MTRFVKDATTLQFNQDPVRPAQRSVKLHQVSEKDSYGDAYVYTKSSRKRGTYRLIFPKLTDAVLSSLFSFFENTVDGSRHTFSWYDYADTIRTARFSKPEIQYTNLGPDRNRVELELFVDSSL